jgi:hypothetical protein
MPRKLRNQYHGVMYHVMSRGDRREKIFLADIDRQDFIKTLAEPCQKTGWQVHAHCLMPKLEIVARLRREMTRSLKAIAALVHLGTSKTANAKLQKHMRTSSLNNTAQAALGLGVGASG